MDIPTVLNAPLELLERHQSVRVLEWYIKFCGGVRFVASWVCTLEGFLEKKMNIFSGREDFVYRAHDIWPFSQKPKIGHLKDDATRFLRLLAFSIST